MLIVFIVLALGAAVVATGRGHRVDCSTPMLDEHGYLIPAAGCTPRRGSLAVDRHFAGV